MKLLRGRPWRDRRFRKSGVEQLERRDLLVEDLLSAVAPPLRGDSGSYQSWFRPSLSADGQLVVFTSDARDLVANDFNNAPDVFLLDKGQNRLQLISHSRHSDWAAAGDSRDASITPDGRYIVFVSDVTDLDVTGIQPRAVPGRQVYRYDTTTGETLLVSATADGLSSAIAGATDPVISADGSHVAFASVSTDIVTGLAATLDQNLFVRNMTNAQTRVATLDVTGTRAVGGLLLQANAYGVSLSGDGRFVVFASSSAELVSGDQNGGIEDIFIRDTVNGVTQMVSRDNSNTTSVERHVFVLPNSLSDDGRYVVFQTAANNIVVGDQNSLSDVFLRDTVTQTTTAVSHRSDGQVANGASFWPAITPNGQIIVFASFATDLMPPNVDTSFSGDIFAYDQTTHAMELISQSPVGTGQVDGAISFPPQISHNGRFVAWTTPQTGYAVLDQNNTDDLYIRDRQQQRTLLVSSRPIVPIAGNAAARDPVVSDAGTVAWFSVASDLVANDNNRFYDIFVRDYGAESATLVTQRDTRFPRARTAEAGGSLNDITPDGRFSIISSFAWNCIGASCNQTASNDLDPGTATLGFWSNLYLVDANDGSKKTLTRYLENGTPRTWQGDGFNGRLSDDGGTIAFAQGSRFGQAPLDPQVNDVNAFLPDVFVQLANDAHPRLISLAFGTLNSGDGASGQEIAVSPDGMHIAFTSFSTNLTSNIDTNNQLDLFLYDVANNSLRMVSRSAISATAAGGTTRAPQFSADSRSLLFVSSANNLVSGLTDTNAAEDLFVYAIDSNSIALVSMNASGAGTGNAGSGLESGLPAADISSDGRFVTFTSSASDLASSDANAQSDVFVRDMLSGTTSLVSLSSTGGASGNAASGSPSITADGRFVSFASRASNLDSQVSDSNNASDVFVRDLQQSTTRLISLLPSGQVGNAESRDPIISDDGTMISFVSLVSNLDKDSTGLDGANDLDLFVYDMVQRRTQLVTANTSGLGEAVGDGAGDDRILRQHGNGQRLAVDLRSDHVLVGDRNHDTDVKVFTAGLYGIISGEIFEDQNANGVRDIGEPPVVDTLVFDDLNGNGLWDDLAEPAAWTATSGAYQLRSLTVASHRVTVLPPRASFVSFPSTENFRVVTLTASQDSVTDISFGVTRAIPDLKPMLTIPTTSQPFAPLDVSWTIHNFGNVEVNPGWQIAFYLSTDETLDGSDQLLLTESITSTIAAGGTLTGTTTLVTPLHSNANLKVLMQADRRRQVVDERNRSNNTAASINRVEISSPNLQLNSPRDLTLTAQRSQFASQLQLVDAGTTLVTAQPASAASSISIKAFRLLPGGGLQLVAQKADRGALVVLSFETLANDTLFIVVGAGDNSSLGNVRLTASRPTLAIAQALPSQLGQAASVTLRVSGLGLGPGASYRIKDSTGALWPSMSVRVEDDRAAWVTFDLHSAAIGAASIIVLRDTQQFEFPSLTIVAEQQGQWSSRVVVPLVTRAGRNGSFWFEYGNQGNGDLLPALVTIWSPTRTPFGTNPDALQAGIPTTFLATGDQPRAGIIMAGRRYTQSYRFAASDSDYTFQAEVVDSRASEALDLSWIEARIEPAAKAKANWPEVWTALKTRIGTTWGQFISVLSQVANNLPDEIGNSRDVLLLLQQLVVDATADVSTSARGTITTNDSALRLAGQIVLATETTTLEVFSAQVLEDGSFVFPSLSAGTYQLQVIGAQLADGAPLVVPAGQHLQGLNYQATAGQSLRGTVRDEAGSTLANVDVSVINEDGISRTETTDRFGRYSLDGLKPGGYRMNLFAENFAQRRIDNIEVTTGSNVQDIVLQAAGRLHGQVNLPAGVDFSALYVELRSLDVVARPLLFSRVFDSSEFVFGELPAGRYSVLVQHNEAVRYDIPEVVITGDVETDLGAVTLVRGARIAGILVSSVPGVDVASQVVTLKIGLLPFLQTVTDVDGNFDFSELPANTYTLSATASGTSATLQTIDLTSGEQSLDHRVDLLLATNVNGHVTFGLDATPLASARVVLVQNGIVRSTRSDANGFYEFLRVGPGDYQLYVGSLSAPSTQSFTILDPADQPVTVDLHVLADTQLLGHVLNSQRQPIADATVTVRQNGFIIAATSTDAQGAYRLLFSSGGNYTVLVESTVAAFNESSPISIVEGESVTVDFTAGTATLRVVTGSNEQLVGTLSRRIENDWQVAGVVPTDSSGVFTFNGLPVGDYVLRIVSEASNLGLVRAVSIVEGLNQVSVALESLSQLTGVIRDVAGEPLSGATVVVRGVGPDEISMGATTESDGTYSIEKIPTGNYRVQVFAPEHRLHEVTSQSIAGDTVLNVDLLLEATRVVGKIFDADTGQPIIDAYVQSYDDKLLVMDRTYADVTSGDYTLTGWNSGHIKLLAAAPGYDAIVVDVDIVAGDINTVPDIELHWHIGDGLDEDDEPEPDPIIKETRPPQPVRIPVLEIREYFWPEGWATVSAQIVQKNNQSIVTPRVKQQEKPERVAKTTSEFTPTACQGGDPCAALRSQVRAREDLIQRYYDNQVFPAYVRMAGHFSALITAMGQDILASFELIESLLAPVASEVLKISLPAELGKAVFEAGKAWSATADLASAINQANAVVNTANAAAHGVQAVHQLSNHGTDVKNPFTRILKGLDVVKFITGLNSPGAEGDLRSSLAEFTQVRKFYELKLKELEKLREELARCELAHGVQPCPAPNAPPPPPRRSGNGGGGSGHSVRSFDPNDITGPAGFSDAHYVPHNQSLDYIIRFENDPLQATAPAQEVIIQHHLDDDLDLTSFELDAFGFGTVNMEVPAGQDSWQQTIAYKNANGSALDVSVSIELQRATRTVTWAFRSLDPQTGILPQDPAAGFLPPNGPDDLGAGYVTFRARPLADRPTGTVITAQASIVFDTNAAIVTNIYSNTLDGAAPTSTVRALPALNLTAIELSWSGSDGSDGSGIVTYDILVAINGGPWQPWLLQTTSTSATYVGVVGNRYGFQAIAHDGAGWTELIQSVPEAETRVVASIVPWQNSVKQLDVSGDGFITAFDALLIINQLNTRAIIGPDSKLPVPVPTGYAPPYFDTSGDGFLTAIDALLVINELNLHPNGEGEDPSGQLRADSVDALMSFWLEDWQTDGERIRNHPKPQGASRGCRSK